MVKIDLYLDPKYFEEYFEYYKSIDWKSYQKRHGLPQHFIVFKFKEKFVVDNKKIKVSLYLINEYVNTWEYNLGLKYEKGEYKQKYNFFQKGNLIEALTDINKTFENEFCTKCLDWEYVVHDKGLCIECINKPYKLTLDETCSVCLEKIENDRFITVCNHTFHKTCVRQLELCPLCRQQI